MSYDYLLPHHRASSAICALGLRSIVRRYPSAAACRRPTPQGRIEPQNARRTPSNRSRNSGETPRSRLRWG